MDEFVERDPESTLDNWKQPTSPFVERIRRKYEEAGYDTSRMSDQQLTMFVGETLEQNGLVQGDMRIQTGDLFTDQYFDLKNNTDRSILGEFSPGFGRGMGGLKSTATGAAGLVAGQLGFEGAEQSLLEQSAQYQQDTPTPSIARYSDLRWDKPEEVARFVIGAIGEVIPSAAETIGSAVVGGGVFGLGAKTIAKKAIRKAIKEKVGNPAEVYKSLNKEFIKNSMKLGAGAGMTLSSVGLSQGEIYSELYDYTKLDPNDPDYVDPQEARNIATAFGTLAGGLDALGAGAILARVLKIPQKSATAWWKKSLMSLPKDVVIEGGTEAVQEAINIVADKYARGQDVEWTSQEIARLKDAGALGAVGGGVFSAVGVVGDMREKITVGDKDITQRSPIDTKQRDTLDQLQELRASETARYKDGDEVEFSNDKGEAETGSVIRAYGDRAEVATPDGSVIDLPMWKLTNPTIKPEENVEESVQPVEAVESTEKPSEWETTKETKRGREVQTSSIKVWDEDGDPFELTVKWYDGEFKSATEYNLDDSGKRLGRVDLTKSLNKVVKDQLKAGDLSALDALRANQNMFTSPDGGAKREAKRQEALKKIKVEQPVEKADQSLSLTVGDKEVTVANLTIKEREDTRKLYDFFVDQSQKNMSRNRNSAIKSDSTEAWASNSSEELSRRLKEAGLGELATTKYLKRLREKLALAGVLDASYAWQSERMGRTRLDEELLQQNKQAAIETRKEGLQLRSKWLKKDAEVKVRGSVANGHQGVVEEITEDGFVKVKDWPDLLTPAGVDPVRKKNRTSPQKRRARQVQTTEEKELESVESEPRVLYNEDQLIDPEFTFKDKDIAFRWERQTTGTRKNNTFRAASKEEFANEVRKWVANYGKTPRNRGVFKKLEGIQIGDKIYDAEIFDDRIEVAGLTIESQKVVDREKKKGAIPKGVKDVDIVDTSSDGPNELDALVKKEDSSAGKRLMESTDQLNRSKVAVVLKQVSGEADYPYGSVRVVTLVDGKATQKGYKTKKYLKRGIAKGYNSDSQKKDKTEKLKDEKSDFSNYEIVGRIVFNKAIGGIDIYYEDMSALLDDPAIKTAQENEKLETAKDTEELRQAKVDSDKIRQIDTEIEELDLLLSGEREIVPSETDLQTARDQILTEWDGGKATDIADSDLELEVYLDDNIDRVAKEITRERIVTIKRQLNTEKERLKSSIENFINADGKRDALLEDLRSRIATIEEYLEKGRDQDGSPYTKVDFDDDLAIIRKDKKYKSIVGDIGTFKADFLADMVAADDQASIGEQFDSGVSNEQELGEIGASSVGRGAALSSTTEMEGSEGSLSDQADTRPAPRREVTDQDVTIAGRGQDLLENTEDEKFIDIVSSNQEVLQQFRNLSNAYKTASTKGDPLKEPYYKRALRDFARLMVRSYTGKGKPYKLSRSADAEAKITSKINSIIKKAFKEAEGDSTEINYLERAAQRIKDAPYEPFSVLSDLLEHMGHTSSSVTQKKVFNLLSDPESVRDDAVDLDVDKLINHINQDGLFDGDELRRLLEEVYGVEMQPDGYYPTYQTQENYFRMLDDLRELVNPNYISDHVYEDTDNSIIRGNRFTDPQVVNRLNTKLPFLQNLIDPITGKLYSYQVLPIDEESADASIANARSSEQSYMAPAENPLETRPDLIQEGQAAMQSFAPNGTTMSLRTALNQILRLSDTFPEISNITRLVLDSKMIDKFEVEFVPWEKFRKYASPEKGILNKSAQVITKDPKTGSVIRKILISDAFNNNPSRKAMDNLMAEIVHEAIHVPVSPALDLGYAFSTGKPSVIKDAIDKHGDPSNLNSTGEELAGIFKTVNEKILPYLRERAGISDYYGLTSVDEFFTEAGSNSKFQEFLRNTQLPASVRKPGILQTVMDFVQSVLAKIGFASANTKSAMDYARTEMEKLMGIASERTQLLEMVEELNLGKINILGNRFDTSDIFRNTNYNELLELISRTAAQNGTAGDLESAADYIRSSTPASQGRSQKGLRTGKDTEGQHEKALEFAEENNLLLDNQEFEKKWQAFDREGGAESDVYYDEESQRMFKRNNLQIHGNDVLAYLERLIIHNFLFPTTAYRLEGFTLERIEEGQGRLGRPATMADFGGGAVEELRVIVSQPFIQGEHSSYDEVRDQLKRTGLQLGVAYSNTARIGMDVDISDVRPGNSITDSDGNVHIIDPIIERQNNRLTVLDRMLTAAENEPDATYDPYKVLSIIEEMERQPNYSERAEVRATKRNAEREIKGAGFTAEDLNLLNSLNEDSNTIIRGNLLTQIKGIKGYHTTDGDVSNFETDPRKEIGGRQVQMGAHFGSTSGTVKKGRGRIVEVSLNINNPLRMPDLNKWDWRAMEKWLIDNNIFTAEDTKRYENIKETGGFREFVIQSILKQKGYDSIVYLNEFEGSKDKDSYIVFDSKNIEIDSNTIIRGNLLTQPEVPLKDFQISSADQKLVQELKDYAKATQSPVDYNEVQQILDRRLQQINKLFKEKLGVYETFKGKGKLDFADMALDDAVSSFENLKLAEPQTKRGRAVVDSLDHPKVIQDIINYFNSLRGKKPALGSDMYGNNTIIRGNRFDESGLQRPTNPRPDDNARVMNEANAAGLNEVIEELIKVHREYGDKTKLDLGEFIDKYGDIGRKKLSTLNKKFKKDLEAFEIDSDSIRVESAGLNKTARVIGSKKAVGYLEKVRQNARSKKERAKIAREVIEKNQNENQQMYEDLYKGRVPARDKLVESFKRRLTSASFQKLQSYVETLPNSGMSAKDIKSIKDLSNEQIGDIMDAVVEARGEIEFNNKEEVFNSLTESTDSRLAPIQGEGINAKVKRMMVMYAIRESKDVLSLLRLGKGLIGEEQQKFRNAASRIASAKTLAQIEQVDKDFPGIMSTPLRAFAKSKREEIKESGRLNKLNLKWEVNDFIDRALGDRSTRLRMALGELEPVAIYDGVEILTLVEDTTKTDASDPDRFKVEKFKVEIKGGKLINRDEFVKRNRVTLQALQDPDVIKRHGHEAWWESMKEQALLALSEPIMDEQFHAQRAAWFSGLQGITERLSNLGPDGIRISQMTTKSVALYRANHSETMAYAKRYNFAAHRVMKHLKIGSQELYSGLYQDIWWWADNHPEYKDAIDGYNALWKHLKEYASIPNRALLDDTARRYVKDMIQKALEARDYEASLNNRLGNRVKDDKIKVQSFINQEMVAFYRSPLDLGLATMPRTINEAHLLDVYNRMSEAGWEPKAEGNQPGAQEMIQEAKKATSSEAMQQVYESLFTEDVVNIFVRPFTHTDVRNSVFRGPQDKDGYSPQIGNSFMEEVFDESGGDVFAMANIIYDQMAENPSAKDRLAWQKYFLGQWHGRYRQLRKASARITKAPTTNSDMMRVTPQSMDARNVETSLPKEFFYYGQYDEVTSNIRLAMMTTTASFGRNGELMNKAAESSRKSLQLDAETFNGIMSQATSSKHPKPQPRYSKAEKTEAYRILRGRGFKNAEKEWNRLRTAAINKAELERVTDHLQKYYGRTNPEGPLADANLLIDILGTQALLVLNNPKSSFWQALSLFEYPNAFRGLNRMAGKGTAAALGNFVNQTFGGIAESFGIEFGKMSRAAEYLKDTHFKTAESKLPFEVYTSMIGSGGDLGESIAKHPLLGMKRYVRRLNDIATHHRTRSDNRQRAPIDPLSLITGIFPYVNNVVNHSVGVGAVHAYTDLIHQVASYIETQGITEFKEFTPEDLGMGEGVLEVVKGEKDGFDRMNKLLVSAGAPSISRLAFNYVDKKKNNPNAEIIDETTAQLINQVAMNQISGEGFTSSPAALTTNPFLRTFATFLRWPLGKMARDLGQIMRDPADRLTTMQALIKYTAITATVTMPAGLSFAMLIDWYDEDSLEKPNNLPPLSPLAALPVIGIPLAMRDEYFSVYAVTSRLAKAGTPFGIGLDLANNVFSKGDPYGSAREFSLDSRIFAFSMFKNLIDAFGTWATAGEFDWQLVGRPIAYGLGGNSILQMTDLVTAMMDIDSEERRVADYIGMRNYIKSTAFMMGIELRPPFKGGGMTTGTSMNTRQMARAAYANDTQDFVAQYQEAIESAKEFLNKNGRDDSPEQYVLNSYRDRDLRTGITARRLSDEDWQAILNALPEDVRLKITMAQQAHQHYLNLIKPKRSSSARRQAIRERALSLM